jgi:hypothetical protein
MNIFSIAIPEMTLLTMASFILLFDVLVKKRFRGFTYGLTQLTLLGCFQLFLCSIASFQRLSSLLTVIMS